jgi:hypothetical protein
MPKLCKTEIASAADLKVFVTDIRSEADLVIHETTDSWAASAAPIWCYTDIQGEADKTVCFVASQFEADLIVYKTDIASDAGWQNGGKAGLL